MHLRLAYLTLDECNGEPLQCGGIQLPDDPCSCRTAQAFLAREWWSSAPYNTMRSERYNQQKQQRRREKHAENKAGNQPVQLLPGHLFPEGSI
jgi:hypothetical protein